jgi:hypothetical protein
VADTRPTNALMRRDGRIPCADAQKPIASATAIAVATTPVCTEIRRLDAKPGVDNSVRQGARLIACPPIAGR